MIVTKKHLPRRTFLRGAGTSLALPLLDAMVPAQTGAHTQHVNAGERDKRRTKPRVLMNGYSPAQRAAKKLEPKSDWLKKTALKFPVQ